MIEILKQKRREIKNDRKSKVVQRQKSYGFITSEEGNDVFVHYSDIISKDKYKTLVANITVAYDIETVDKGIKAVNVTAVS